MYQLLLYTDIHTDIDKYIHQKSVCENWIFFWFNITTRTPYEAIPVEIWQKGIKAILTLKWTQWSLVYCKTTHTGKINLEFSQDNCGVPPTSCKKIQVLHQQVLWSIKHHSLSLCNLGEKNLDSCYQLNMLVVEQQNEINSSLKEKGNNQKQSVITVTILRSQYFALLLLGLRLKLKVTTCFLGSRTVTSQWGTRSAGYLVEALLQVPSAHWSFSWLLWTSKIIWETDTPEALLHLVSKWNYIRSVYTLSCALKSAVCQVRGMFQINPFNPAVCTE